MTDEKRQEEIACPDVRAHPLPTCPLSPLTPLACVCQNLEKAAAQAHTCLTKFTAGVKAGLVSHAGACGPVTHCGAGKHQISQKVHSDTLAWLAGSLTTTVLEVLMTSDFQPLKNGIQVITSLQEDINTFTIQFMGAVEAKKEADRQQAELQRQQAEQEAARLEEERLAAQNPFRALTRLCF